MARYPDSYAGEQEIARRAAEHPVYLDLRRRRMRRTLRLLGAAAGDTLLDAGCGNGVNAVLAAEAGMRVVAVEIDERQHRLARLLFERLGLESRVRLERSDILGLDLAPASVDGGYSFEFVEHISDPVAFYGRVRRWLRPGRSFYSRTGANGANARLRRVFAREHDERDAKFYAPDRRRRVLALAPEAGGAALEALVAGTRGLLQAELEAAVAAWRADGTLPPPHGGRTPRDPDTGAYEDRVLDPAELLADMRAGGLDARLVRPDVSAVFSPSPVRRAGYRAAGAVISATHPASLPVAPWLEVMGTRPAAGDR
jgi:SAM-dependent methyltransferase